MQSKKLNDIILIFNMKKICKFFNINYRTKNIDEINIAIAQKIENLTTNKVDFINFFQYCPCCNRRQEKYEQVENS